MDCTSLPGPRPSTDDELIPYYGRNLDTSASKSVHQRKRMNNGIMVNSYYDHDGGVFHELETKRPIIEVDDSSNPTHSNGSFLDDHPWMKPNSRFDPNDDPSGLGKNSGFASQALFTESQEIFIS